MVFAAPSRGGCHIVLRSVVLATALVSLALPALARGELSERQKRKALLPAIQATTECIAQEILRSPTALSHARQNKWSEAVQSMPEVCKALGSTLIAEHDRLYGPGTGKAFVEGPYASDLPRALKARIRPALKRQAAQSGFGAQITARGFGEAGDGSIGSASPVVWMTDALQGQRGAPPQDPQGTLQGLQLARVRQGAPAARQPDHVGDAGGLGGVASAQDRPPGPLARILGPGHRNWAPSAPGLGSSLAAD